MKVQLRTLLLLTPLLAVAACGRAQPPSTAAAAESSAKRTIVVPILARSGSRLQGTATFVEVPGGVKVTVDVTGAPPGKVATHVHETGDCRFVAVS